MNIKQLRCIVEVTRQGLSISKAAGALHASQPGVSTLIQRLEKELGFEIFVRRNHRLIDLTHDGRAVIERAQRALLEIDAIRDLGRASSKAEIGALVVAASHAQARFTLPVVMRRFIRAYPKVRLTVTQCNRKQIADMLTSGEADIGIMSNIEALAGKLVLLPCRVTPRILLVRRGHPLLKRARPTLADIAKDTLVVDESSYTTDYVLGVFRKQGLDPPKVMKATNADVMKAYVEQGLGVSVLPKMVFNVRRDKGVQAINVDHLFEPSRTYVLLHRQRVLRPYAFAFIEMLAPQLDRGAVQKALA